MTEQSRTKERNGHIEQLVVPKFPLDPECNEERSLDSRVGQWLADFVAGRMNAEPREVVCSLAYNWCGDPVDLAELRVAARRLLVEQEGYRENEIRCLTYEDLLPLLERAMWREERAVARRWRTELSEVYHLGLQHRDAWHKLIRELIAQVEEYDRAVDAGDRPAWTPLPSMRTPPSLEPGQTFPAFAIVESGDLGYMALMLGWKLESLFAVRGTFIPEDIQGRLRYDDYSEEPRWSYLGELYHVANGFTFANLDELKTYWLHLRRAFTGQASSGPEAIGPVQDAHSERHPHPRDAGDNAAETSVGKGESWSRIMPLRDIADRIYKSPRKWRSLKSHYSNRLRQLGGKGSRQWQIRLDGLPENIIKELNRP